MFKPKRLIILILIVGFLFSCGPPSVTEVDGEAMGSLMSLIFLCSKLSREDSDAECTFINLENYGVLESSNKLRPDVNIQIAIIDHKFSATASHIQSEMVFLLDSAGKIAPITR